MICVACCCIPVAAACGVTLFRQAFSCQSSIAFATSSHCEMPGGVFASFNWAPKIFKLGSAASAGSLQASCRDGRSLIVLYQLTWVLFWVMNSTNFHAASGFLLFLKTTQSLPPTNEVADLSPLGMGATAHFDWSRPAFVIRPIIHGPEMNIGSSPVTNAWIRSKPGGDDPRVRPFLKKSV